MSIFSHLKKDTLIAVFDIADSSIGGALLLRHSQKLPEILVSVRFPTDFSFEIEFKKLERTLHKTFEKVIGYLKKKMPAGWQKPDLAIVVFSSPYHIPQSKTIHIRKEKPFEITNEFIQEIIDKEKESFKKKWHEEHPQEKNNDNIKLLEQELMAFKLNGYPVRQPAKKFCFDFEASAYFSIGIKNICEKIEEYLEHNFGKTPIRFQTFPFVAFSVLKNIVDIKRGIVILNIDGEITEAILIKNGILEETISFPFGENFLIRRIVSVFRFSPEESVALLNQYIRGDLHSETQEKVRKILEDAGKKWCEFFKKAQDESPALGFTFQNRLIIGSTASHALKDFIICTQNQPLHMQFLLPETFKNHFLFKKGFSENRDILLLLSLLFANNIQNL